MTDSTTPQTKTSLRRCALAILAVDIKDAYADCQHPTDATGEFSREDWYSDRARLLAAEARVAQAEAMITHPSVSDKPFAPQQVMQYTSV